MVLAFTTFHALPVRHPLTVRKTRMLPQSLPLTRVERLQLQNLYLCVRVEGQDAAGTPRYAYFGLFADKLLTMMEQLKKNPAMNPKDLGGIVLARAAGEPSDEIHDFMRMKFSFGDPVRHSSAILEISH
jgi:hypothetical protein